MESAIIVKGKACDFLIGKMFSVKNVMKLFTPLMPQLSSKGKDTARPARTLNIQKKLSNFKTRTQHSNAVQIPVQRINSLTTSGLLDLVAKLL